MVVLYLLMGLSILVLNFEKIIPTFILILEAFNLKSVYAEDSEDWFTWCKKGSVFKRKWSRKCSNVS